MNAEPSDTHYLRNITMAQLEPWLIHFFMHQPQRSWYQVELAKEAARHFNVDLENGNPENDRKRFAERLRRTLKKLTVARLITEKRTRTAINTHQYVYKYGTEVQDPADRAEQD